MKKSSRHSGPRSGRQNGRNRRSPQLVVLYEDDAVIALNKPAGLLSVPVEGSAAPSALTLLTEELKSRNQRTFVVHRIDRFTSGILLFAKTGRDRDALIRQFCAHKPMREYLAVVRGQVTVPAQTLVHHFRRVGIFQKLTGENDPRGARAELRYSVERLLREATLVRVSLVTGLQNQIRVQFAAIGHPVIGDRKYSPVEALEKRISRVALHAAHLQFAHPRTGVTISVECEPPADFQGLVRVFSLPVRTSNDHSSRKPDSRKPDSRKPETNSRTPRTRPR